MRKPTQDILGQNVPGTGQAAAKVLGSEWPRMFQPKTVVGLMRRGEMGQRGGVE
jgi:hypothetical protein